MLGVALLAVIGLVALGLVRTFWTTRKWSDERENWGFALVMSVFFSLLILGAAILTAYSANVKGDFFQYVNGDKFYCERPQENAEASWLWPGLTVTRYVVNDEEATCYPISLP